MRGEIVGRDNGTAAIEPPDDIPAGSYIELKIIYTAGAKPVIPGGSVRFEIPYAFSAPQTIYPFDPGYTTFSCSNPDVKFHTYFAPTGYEQTEEWKKERFYYVTRWGRHIFVFVDEGELREADILTCTFGDQSVPSGTGALAPYFEHTAEFTVATDADGKRSAPFSGYELVKNSPRVRIIANPASKLEIIAASVAREGKAKVILQGRDRFNNLDRRYADKLFLKLDNNVVAEEKIGANDKGVLIVGALEIAERSGPAYVEAFDEKGKMRARSNPVINADNVSPYNLFWGDIHGHTRLSDGLGRAEEYYTFGREVGCLDFCAIADHAQYLSEEDWQYIRKAAEEFNDDGRYVTFLGHEVSDNRENGYGDQNIYYPHTNGSLLRPTNLQRSQFFEFPELAQAAKADGGMIILHQHYPGLKYYDPELVRLAEIYSVWGASEYVNNPYPIANETKGVIDYTGKKVQDLLQRGYRLGIIAGSDCHAGRPGLTDWLRTRKRYKGGLAGVWAEKLTRKDIWDALWNRRCYGTTGARIILFFKVNDFMMGREELIEEKSPLQSKRRISIKVYGTERLKAVEIIRNNRKVHTFAPEDEYAELEWEDDEFLPSVNFPAADTPGPFTYYYVRVSQQDGEMAWSSPVWLTGK